MEKIFVLKKIFTPEKIFVIITLFFGLILVLLTPPYQIPDEPQHFLRTLSLVNNNRLIAIKKDNTTGDYLSANLDIIHEKYVPIIKHLERKTSFKELKQYLKINYDNKNLMFISFPNTALYSPVCYIPQIIGILCAKIFTNSIVAFLIFGRLFSLFFFMAMGYITIKTIPVLKWGALLIFLTPMNLIQASGFSADTVLFCLAAFYFAKIIQFCLRAENLTKKEITLLALLALLIALTKQSFFFTLFIFLIPKKKFLTNYFLKIAAILAPALIVTIIWSLTIKNIYIPLNGADAAMQLKYILSHPAQYLGILFKPTYDSLILLYEAICIMGWLEMSVPKYYYFLYVVLFILNGLVTSSEHNCLKTPINKKIILAILCITNYIIISTMLYLSWAAPGEFYPTMVLQGRYFSILQLPLMMVVYTLIPHIKSKYSNIINAATVLFLICILTQVAYIIFIRYY